jgi:nitrous oxidase accessory protein NosD
MRVLSRRLARAGLIGLVVAMAGALFVSPVAAASPAGVYVAEVHGSDANPCSSSQPCLTIGHAVSVAVPGATVHVDLGTYHEQVSVTKRLTLVGNHTVVDATGQTGGIQPLAGMGIVGYGILVYGPAASGSAVKGFTVEHATGEGILIAQTSKIRIEDNTVLLNDAGFKSTLTVECKAQGNVPGDCGEGLHLLSVTRSHVTNNRLENNIGGILVTDEVGSSAHNVISGNSSMVNILYGGITLASRNSLALTDASMGGVYDNLVINNFSAGNEFGVGIFAVAPGTASYNNRVIHNELALNVEAGVAIHADGPGQNVSGNAIVNNTIFGDGIDANSGSGHPTGIALFSAVVPVTVAVTDNQISGEFWGIFRAGLSTVHGLSSNRYSSSVTNHTN